MACNIAVFIAKIIHFEFLNHPKIKKGDAYTMISLEGKIFCKHRLKKIGQLNPSPAPSC
jgi:hypothetical protein